MYKPPENMNRVKAMLSKFENNENTSLNISKNSNVTKKEEIRSPRKVTEKAMTSSNCVSPERKRPEHTSLSRQYSDPVKRNIKRTPAFRLDKSNVTFQENFSQANGRNRYVDNKIKLFDSRLKENHCDNEENCNNSISRSRGYARRKIKGELNYSPDEAGAVKALRNKFSNIQRHNTDISSNDGSTDDENFPSEIKLLYAKPIPKSLRTKSDPCSKESDSEHSVQDLCFVKNPDDKTESGGIEIQKEHLKWLDEITTITNGENNLNKSSHREHASTLTNLNIDDSSVVRQRPNIIQLKSDFNTNAKPLSDNSEVISIETKLTTLERKLQNSTLTDTLKRALNKPLPVGPAPKKPPRTFIHSPKIDSSSEEKDLSPILEKNISHLHLDKNFKKKLNSNLKKNIDTHVASSSSPKSSPKSRADAKYMLDKLENALRNNKIRLKRNPKVDTSEDEGDDDKQETFKKTSLSNLYTTPPANTSHSLPKFNLNCLTSSFDCTKTHSIYEQIKEPNSCFFLGEKVEEPVYATPFQFPANSNEDSEDLANHPIENTNLRNSLYYMEVHRQNHIPECLKRKLENHHLNVTTDDVTPAYHWTWKPDRLILKKQTQARLRGSFFYGYTIMNLFAGTICELVGPRITVTIGLVCSGIITSLLPLLAPIHWGLIFLIRVLIGLGTGMIFPSFQVIIANWAPPEEKGRFFICALGANLGTVVTFSLHGFICERTNWIIAAFYTGGFSFVASAIFFFLVRDIPQQHPSISEGELKIIVGENNVPKKKRKRVPPYKAMILSVPFWAFILIQLGNSWGVAFMLTSQPQYMSDVMGFSSEKAGILCSIPHVARVCMGIFFSIFGDWFGKKGYWSGTFQRKFYIVISHIIPGLLLIGMVFNECSIFAAVMLPTLALGLNGCAVLTNLMNPQDLAPNFAGTIFGIGNCIGTSSGLIVNELVGFLTREKSSIQLLVAWKYLFCIGGGVYSLTGVLFLIFGSAKLQPYNTIPDTND